MSTTVIIQARMGSSRLPGKILLPLGTDTVLAQVIKRVSAAKGVDRIVIATTDQPNDDAVVAEAQRIGVDFFRGSESDVLARYYDAARHFNCDIIVRVTSDCPLYDPTLLTKMLKKFNNWIETKAPVDYFSNTLTRSYPRGLDTEIFRMGALENIYQSATSLAEREHVTPYFYRNPALFNIEEQIGTPDLSNHRWTLDTDEDYRFIQTVFKKLEDPSGTLFSTNQLLELLEQRPDIMVINSKVQQKPISH
ncbi:MAG: glycosyltransferase family protein [Magnetococcales bacterium]|nr:glycosyltransferase family protein [Magnetococcales bacterium]